MITDDLDMERSPVYRVGEVAKVFFAKSAHWLRWREKTGAFTITQEGRSKTKESNLNARSYNLRDIEQMIVALHEKDAIGAKHASIALDLVQCQAEMYGMFETPYEYDSKTYDLSVAEVAAIAGRSETWVRQHVEDLGGVKRQWDEGVMQESWRFPSEGIDELIYELQGEA